MKDVLILNRQCQPINAVSQKRALKMLCKSFYYDDYKLEIMASYDKKVRLFDADMNLPAVIMVKHDQKIGKSRKLIKPFNKKEIWYRDSGECQYCGKKVTLNEMHWDHVHPSSKGGKTNWTNIVCCCLDCNKKKGNKSLQEFGVPLRNKPQVVYSSSTVSQAIVDRLKHRINKIPHESWKMFIYWEIEN